ncbi:MAG TPA: cyclic nucleotide-binding domain-containing protein [Pyrinomonadaceae bacterium]|nr:cyclic nucleotide-binding domain-containing protein [Pyrinomonadaceae bacterium]
MNYFEFATHIASVLTLLAYLVKEMLWLRFLTILASIAGIIFNYTVPATPLWAVIWWNVVFIIINVIQIMIILKERSNVTFTEEEQELYETLFKNFEPFEFMKLLRIGSWREAKKGQALTIEAQPLDSIILIYNGLLSVEIGGQQVRQMKDGGLIGEISFITGGPATATVTALEPTRYMAWPKEEMRRLLNRNPNMRFAMQTVFSKELVKKLARPKTLPASLTKH